MVRRASVQHGGLSLAWRPKLTFLRSRPQAMSLICREETGLTELGEDDILIEMWADGSKVPFVYFQWFGADTGEVLGLSGPKGGIEEIAFVEGIELRLTDDDLIPTATGTNTGLIGPMAGGTPIAQHLDITVADWQGDGRYRFTYSLARS